MPNESEDDRSAVYQPLHHIQLVQEEEANGASADLVLNDLFPFLAPKSVLDVGCGIGTWLDTAKRLGAKEIVGIEGKWLDKTLARIPAEAIFELDLEKAFDLGRRFDLAISLEVAEHLSSAAAGLFVESLVRHSDVILFSAAIPFQGGTHHVNEQFLDYWSKLFFELGYVPIDCIRARIWNNPAVHWWLRQNMVLFAKKELTTDYGPLHALAQRHGPISIVLPELYAARVQHGMKIVEEHQRLIALLSSGNTFSVLRQPDGRLTVSRIT